MYANPNGLGLQAVEIEINHACNRKCSYCPNSIMQRKSKGMMSLDLFQVIIDNLVDINFNGRLSFDFYNEPTLHPQLDNFVKLVKQRLPDVSVHLYSNGTLINHEKFTSLKNVGVDFFIITQHEEDINSAAYAFADVYSTLSEDSKSSVKFRQHKQINLSNRGGILKHISTENLNLTKCSLPSHMLTITVSGNVLACFEDYEENLTFGNLTKEKLIDIWHKPEYTSFRDELNKGLRHRYKPCKECNRREALPPFY